MANLQLDIPEADTSRHSNGESNTGEAKEQIYGSKTLLHICRENLIQFRAVAEGTEMSLGRTTDSRADSQSI